MYKSCANNNSAIINLKHIELLLHTIQWKNTMKFADSSATGAIHPVWSWKKCGISSTTGLRATRAGPPFKIKIKNDALCSNMREKMLNINVYFIIYIKCIRCGVRRILRTIWKHPDLQKHSAPQIRMRRRMTPNSSNNNPNSSNHNKGSKGSSNPTTFKIFKIPHIQNERIAVIKYANVNWRHRWEWIHFCRAIICRI